MMAELTPTSISHSPLGSVILGRYRIVELLGDGGMCSVYRAEDRERKEPVAIKVLAPDGAARPDLAARFRREAMIGKRIVDPHVVRVHDSGSLEDGSLYLGMELVDGESLAGMVERGRLPLGRAVEIAGQMLSGLEAAHALGIVHRDIKPGNVLVTRSRGKDVVKLIDFGIASNDRAAFKLTVAGVGTPEYVSPEMAMGVPVDERADLYSVGVALFQMVTGRLWPLLIAAALSIVAAWWIGTRPKREAGGQLPLSPWSTHPVRTSDKHPSHNHP